MIQPDKHPEQDPAEGSRETIERDLKQQDELNDKGKGRAKIDRIKAPDAGAEAAEPSPGN